MLENYSATRHIRVIILRIFGKLSLFGQIKKIMSIINLGYRVDVMRQSVSHISDKFLFFEFVVLILISLFHIFLWSIDL